MRRSVLIAAGVCLTLAAWSAPLAFLVFDTKIAQPGRLPDGWRLRVNHGNPDVTVIHDAGGAAIHLKSRSSSFALERGIDVDAGRYPYLSWRWKVTELPRGGDFRRSSADDQAAQLIIAFGERHFISYVWDSTAPKDSAQSLGLLPLMHLYGYVCRSGAADLNQWLSEVRNVAQDYRRAYGHDPSQHVKGIRLQINSQHTGTGAESYFGDIAFRSTP